MHRQPLTSGQLVLLATLTAAALVSFIAVLLALWGTR